MKLTFGSDPELMLQDDKAGRIISSIPVLKNDKKTPLNLRGGIKVYADNVLVEMAMPPSSTRAEFLKSIRASILGASKKLGEGYSLLAKAAHVYDADQLVDKQAIEVGCNPSFNAYDRCQNPIPEFKGGLRSGSFHIHIGHPGLVGEGMNNIAKKGEVIKLLDFMVGLPSLSFDEDESSVHRRRLYGRAGEFRPTPYGVEWRVLGNFALRSPELTGLVFDLVAHAMKLVKEDGSIVGRPPFGGAEVYTQLAINKCDKKQMANIYMSPDIFDQKLIALSKEIKAPKASLVEAWT